MSDVGIALPRYKCHKEVWALKIKDLRLGPDPDAMWMCFPEEPGYAPFMLSSRFIREHHPQIGGYWAKYKDGYESYSPAEAFEEGYTRV